MSRNARQFATYKVPLDEVQGSGKRLVEWNSQLAALSHRDHRCCTVRR